MKQLTQKTKWIAYIIIAMQCYPSFVFAQSSELMKGINHIPFSTPPLNNGRDTVNWGYNSMYGIYAPLPNKIVGKIYDDLQCTLFDTYTYTEELIDLAPAVYLKANIPNSNNLLAALYFGGVTDYNTEVLFTIDTQGNVIDTLEVGVGNSGMPIKEYRITKDFKIIISNFKVTNEKPILMTEKFPNEIKGYREDSYYHIDENSRFVKDKVERFPEKTFEKQRLRELHAWEL